MAAKFFIRLSRIPIVIIIFTFAATGFLVYLAGEGLFNEKNELIVDSSVEPFMSRNSGTYDFFKDMRNAFGNEEVLVIAVKPKNDVKFDLNFFLMLDEFTLELKEKVPGVKNVASLTNTPRVEGTCSGKSFFHLESVGSVCRSVLDQYKNELQCIKNKDQFIQQVSTSNNDDEGLDEDEGLGDDEGLDEDEDLGDDEGLDEDEGLGDDENTETLDETASEDQPLESETTNYVCTPFVYNKSESHLYQEIDSKVTGIMTEIAQHKIIHRDLISTDLSTAAIVIEFEVSAKPNVSDTQMIVKELVHKYETKDIRIGYSGQSRQEYLGSKTITEDILRILPFSLFFMLATLFFSFNKSIRGMLIPLSVVVIGILCTFGFIAISGITLNMVTMVLPPLLICVGSAYIIHFVNQYFTESSKAHLTTPRQVVEAALKHITVPLVVTALTTLAGFAALTASPIPAIKQMGIFACIGIAIIIFITLSFVPSILVFLPLPKIKKREVGDISRLDKILNAAANSVGRHSRKYIILWVVIGLVAAYGVSRVTVNSSAKNFSPESSIEQDLTLVENNLAGTNSLRLIFSAKNDPKDLQTAETMNGLISLKSLLLGQQEMDESLKIDGIRVDKVYTAADYLNIYRNGLDNIKDKEVVTFFVDSKKNGWPKYLSDDENLLQTNIRMKMRGTTELLEFRGALEEKLPVLFPKLNVQFTGSGILSAESADNIAKGQVQSVSLALAIIFVIMSIMFFSFKMGVLALYPNVLAILAFFGTLGWLNIPIGVVISIIASIALGIGVDDTIHYLSHFNINLRKVRNEKKAAMETLVETGKPMVFTTISLGLGFIIFLIADMETQVLFGALTAYTLVFCLFADLNFMPSIMVHTKMITVWDYIGLKLTNEQINDIQIFNGMTLNEVKFATLMAYTTELEKGEILFKEKDMGSELFVILEGGVDIYKDPDFHAQKQLLIQLNKGASFGEMGLFRNAERTATTEANQKSKFLILNKKVLQGLQKRYPKVATKLFNNLAINLAESNIRSTTQLASKISDSVAKFSEDKSASALGRLIDEIADHGVLNVQDKKELDRIIYADGKVSREEKLQIERLNRLIEEGFVKEGKSLVDFVDEIIADGIITIEKRQLFNEMVYSDHYISPEEQEQIDRLDHLIASGELKEELPAFRNLYQNMTNREIKWLNDHFEIKKFPKGVKIFTEGDYADYMMFVLKGKFNLFKKIDGKDSTFATILENSLIACLSVLTNKYERQSSMLALEDSEVVYISQDAIEKLKTKNIKLATKFYYNIICMLSDRLEEASIQLYHYSRLINQ